MRPLAVALALALCAPALAAQSGATLLVPISEGLLMPAEEEVIVCSKQTAQDQLRVQRQPMGRFAPRTGETAPVTWAVTMTNSGRNITILTSSEYRPREVSVLGTQENVRIRYFADGTPQDGRRAVTPRGREAGPATPVTSGLDSLDAPQLYALARELVYRCTNNMIEPVPVGSVIRRIPPR